MRPSFISPEPERRPLGHLNEVFPCRSGVVLDQALDLGPHRLTAGVAVADQGITLLCGGLQCRLEDGADLLPTQTAVPVSRVTSEPKSTGLMR